MKPPLPKVGRGIKHQRYYASVLVMNKPCAKLPLVGLAMWVALCAVSMTARSAESGRGAGSDVVTQTEREKAANEQPGKRKPNQVFADRVPLTPEQEAKRQSDIKALKDYYEAEKKSRDELDRVWAAWGDKANREKWKREHDKAPAEKPRPGQVFVDKAPLTPEQEAKRQSDIKALKDYYEAEKKSRDELDRVWAAWGDKANREKWKREHNEESTQRAIEKIRDELLFLPPMDLQRKPPGAPDGGDPAGVSQPATPQNPYRASSDPRANEPEGGVKLTGSDYVPVSKPGETPGINVTLPTPPAGASQGTSGATSQGPTMMSVPPGQPPGYVGPGGFSQWPILPPYISPPKTSTSKTSTSKTSTSKTSNTKSSGGSHTITLTPVKE
ncbi:MAG: hypothetical protein HZA91_08335 [Verrucomicrobia bacterium]|nr:hypothetical protein [Verrucomicrobiota bacterium]